MGHEGYVITNLLHDTCAVAITTRAYATRFPFLYKNNQKQFQLSKHAQRGNHETHIGHTPFCEHAQLTIVYILVISTISFDVYKSWYFLSMLLLACLLVLFQQSKAHDNSCIYVLFLQFFLLCFRSSYYSFHDYIFCCTYVLFIRTQFDGNNIEAVLVIGF